MEKEWDIDLNRFLESVLRHAVHYTRARRGLVAMVQLETGELTVHSAIGEGWNEEMRRMRLRIVNEEGRGIIAHVATTGKPYRATDVIKDPYYVQFFEDVRSELCVPISDRAMRTVGVMLVDSDHTNAFTAAHTEYMVEVAEQAGAGFSLTDFAMRERVLIEIGKELSRTQDADSILDMGIHAAVNILRAADCSVFLWEPDRTHLVLRASAGALAPLVGDDEVSYAAGQGLTGWVFQHRQSVRVADIRRDERWRGLYKELPVTQLGAFMAVPLASRDRIMGVMRVIRRARPKAAFMPDEFTVQDEALLQTLASQAAVALENAGLVRRLVHSERMAAWGEMSARAQHMVGNALFGIKGHMNEMKYVVQQPEINRTELGDLVRRIEDGIFRLDSILHDFRDFVTATRIEEREVDMVQLLRSVVAEYSASGKHGVAPEVTLVAPETLPPVLGDDVKLRNCLGELLENAIIRQNEQPKVVVSAAPALTHPELPPDMEVSLPALRIDVEDFGPGVAAGRKKKIFEPFFSTRSQGMGLGLSIVRGIITAHRGAIAEIGTEGKGAHFVIAIPVASRKETKASTARVARGAPPHG